MRAILPSLLFFLLSVKPNEVNCIFYCPPLSIDSGVDNDAIYITFTLSIIIQIQLVIKSIYEFS